MANNIVTQEDIKEMEQMLQNDNRTGVYLKYYEITGSKQALLEAQISTFSGFEGGIAELANENLKKLYPVKYNVEVDDFSREITAKFIQDLKDDDARYLTDDEMLLSAKSVWAEKGLGDQFPGNIFVDGSFLTEGTWISIKNIAKEIGTLGLLSDGDPIRPENFNNEILYDNDYEIREVSHNGEDISYLANKGTGKVFYVWDSKVSEDFKYTKLLLERGNLKEGEFHYISGRNFTYIESDHYVYGNYEDLAKIKSLPSLVVKVGEKLINIPIPEEIINSDGTISKENIIKLSSEFAENNNIKDYSLNIREDKNIDISLSSESVIINNFGQIDNLSKITLVKDLNLVNKTVTFKNPDGSVEIYKIDDQLLSIAQQYNADLNSLSLAAANGDIFNLSDREIVADNGGSMYVYRLDDQLKITNTDNDASFIPATSPSEYTKILENIFGENGDLVPTVKSYVVQPGDSLSVA